MQVFADTSSNHPADADFAVGGKQGGCLVNDDTTFLGLGHIEVSELVVSLPGFYPVEGPWRGQGRVVAGYETFWDDQDRGRTQLCHPRLCQACVSACQEGPGWAGLLI